MKWIVATLMLVVLLGTWWSMSPFDTPYQASINNDHMVFTNPDEIDQELIESEQHAAAVAALASAGQPPVSGILRERPEFVSRLEWQILKSMANERADSERELIRMVNYLRFSKQLEWWQSHLGHADTAQHHQLGWQLLDDIPERVNQQDMAAEHAQQLQITLLETLVPDDRQRREYLQREAQRIGITFHIRNTDMH